MHTFTYFHAFMSKNDPRIVKTIFFVKIRTKNTSEAFLKIFRFLAKGEVRNTDASLSNSFLGLVNGHFKASRLLFQLLEMKLIQHTGEDHVI